MNEAEIRIAQTILPRDWTSLRDVVLKVVAFFGRDLDLVMINRYLHEGKLIRSAPPGTRPCPLRALGVSVARRRPATAAGEDARALIVLPAK